MFQFIISFIVGLVLAVIAVVLYRRFILKESTITHLPLQKMGFHHIPAVPFVFSELVVTLARIAGREAQAKQAKAGLTTEYTIQGITANAFAFTFGGQHTPLDQYQAFKELHQEVEHFFAEQKYNQTPFLEQKLKTETHDLHESPNFIKSDGNPPLTSLFLDKPEQFSIAWTTLGNLYQNAAEQCLPKWSKSLTDAEEATQQFWALVAQYSAAYNLLIVQKLNQQTYSKFKTHFHTIWNDEIEALYQTGKLYAIDLRIFETLTLQEAEGFIRFTPAVCMLLQQDATSKKLLPMAISVAGNQGSNRQFYLKGQASDSAWLYAMQASKAAVTLYGIWIGHVYHWHIVNAAMIMTMLDNIPTNHSIYQLLAPQSKYTIGFDESLLFLWKVIAPPTSLTTSMQLIQLLDTFAKDRLFFDDDPKTTLQKMGIQKEDFTVEKDWDAFPVVGYYMSIWEMVEEYTTTFVRASYPNDASVLADTHLQNWINASSNPHKGNIKGLPVIDSRQNLIDVLASLIYRKTAHGIPNLENTLTPALTFVANYPPCLQNNMIPEPDSTFDTKELLRYLPNTGTIGLMITFYYTFIYTTPYETFVPLSGVAEDLFFEGGLSDERNVALVKFRKQLIAFIDQYTHENQIITPLNSPQYHQWSLSVEV